MDETPVPTPRPEATSPEANRRTAGQRRINIIWEATQSVIALATVGTGMYVAASMALQTVNVTAEKPSATVGFQLISNAVFLVVGFYFGRTNHTRQGGIGHDFEATR